MHLCLKCLCAKTFCTQWFFCARDFSLTVRAFWRAEQLRWVEKNFEEMRNWEGWSVLGRDENSWEELTCWDEVRWVRRAYMMWDEMKCGVWSAKCEVRGVKSTVWSLKKRFIYLALHCNVIVLRSYSWTTTRQQLRTKHARRPGWRTAHASSIDDKGLIVYS